jgi:hypothetical protein
MRHRIPAFLAVSLLVCAGRASGQDTSAIEVGTVTLGPVKIQPSLAVKDLGRDNNVFNEAVNPKSDFTMTVSPKAIVLFNPGPMHLTYTESTDYVYYKKYASERGNNVASTVQVSFDVGPFQPYAGTSGKSTRDRYDDEVDLRARHHDRGYNAGLNIHLFSRTTIGFSAHKETTEFDSGIAFRGQDLATSFNSTIEGVEARAGMALTPLTSFSVIVDEDQQRFALSPERNSDTFRVLPTLTFSPLAMLNGTASVGYRHFTSQSPSVPDFTGVVATVTLGSTLYQRVHFDGLLKRDLQYSYDEASTYFITTGGTLTATYALFGPLDLRVTGARDRLQYHPTAVLSSSTSDTVLSYGAGIGVRLKKRLRLGVNGNWSQRDSQQSADRDFRNRKVYVTVNWGA